VPASIYFFSYFHRVAPAVVAGDLMRAFSITAASLGNLAAIYPYVFAAMALVAGSLADILGPRWTLSLGATTMGAGAVLFGLAPTFGVAFGGRLLVGLGASVVLIAWLSLNAEWFRPHEFTMVAGTTQTVGNAGALAASAPLALLVEAIGWRSAFVAIGVSSCGLGLAAALFIRDRPQALGLPAINPDRRAGAAPTLAQVARGIPRIMANPRTWPPVLASGGVYATLIAFFGLWGVPYLTQVYGLSRVQAAGSLSLLAVGVGIGSPLIGWLSDRWLGLRRLPLAALTALYALCWAPLAFPAAGRLPVELLAPFFFVMGLASSAIVLVWSCVREVNDPERVGITIGFCNLPLFLCFALVQWLMGVVLDARWAGLTLAGARVYPPEAYRAAFALCFAIAVAALILACLVTETRCRNTWTRGA
jgi:sugar phosphate permease